MLPFLVHLVIPAVLALLTVVGLVASARLRVRRHHASVRIELEARAGTATDGVVLLRGKLVVEGEGCASERGDGKAPVAARTHWGSVERFWLSDSVASTNERAPMLWLETAKGAVRIEGPVAVELGSSLRCSGHRAFVDRQKRFDVTTTVVDGDEVLLLGRRKEEAQDRSTGGSYRKSATRGAVGPTPRNWLCPSRQRASSESCAGLDVARAPPARSRRGPRGRRPGLARR